MLTTLSQLRMPDAFRPDWQAAPAVCLIGDVAAPDLHRTGSGLDGGRISRHVIACWGSSSIAPSCAASRNAVAARPAPSKRPHALIQQGRATDTSLLPVYQFLPCQYPCRRLLSLVSHVSPLKDRYIWANGYQRSDHSTPLCLLAGIIPPRVCHYIAYRQTNVKR